MKTLVWQLCLFSNLLSALKADNSERSISYETNSTVQNKTDGIVLPTGTIMIYATEKKPSLPWLLCDGAEVSRISFKNLFDTIGTKYGAGNGVNTFNLPDLRGRVVIGVDHSELRTKKMFDVGLTGGNHVQKLSLSQMPKHSHGKGSLDVASAGAHQHSITDPGHNHGGFTGYGANGRGGWGLSNTGVGSDRVDHQHSIPWGYTSISIQTAGSHTHSITGETDAVGNNEEFEILPPFQSANYIIYAD